VRNKLGVVVVALLLMTATLVSPAARFAVRATLRLSSSGPAGVGYWLADSTGKVRAYGAASVYGSPTDRALRGASVVGMAPTVGGKGYWVVTAPGRVFAFGNARSYGPDVPLASKEPIVGMARSADGKGYWLVSSSGGVFSFGDATFRGSAGSMRLKARVVGIAATPSGSGYWLATSDGDVLAFGNARPHGVARQARRASAVAGIAAAPDGKGYWLVTARGKVIAFGDAKNFGSVNAGKLKAAVVGIAATSDGRGYWLAAKNGSVYAFGDAVLWGPEPGKAPAGRWVAAIAGTLSRVGAPGAKKVAPTTVPTTTTTVAPPGQGRPGEAPTTTTPPPPPPGTTPTTSPVNGYGGPGAAVCGTSVLVSPYSAGNHPALGTTSHVAVIAAGSQFNNAINEFGTTAMATANTTYYFQPGTYTLGNGSNNQVQMGANDWYVGEYSGGTGATVSGQYDNQYAFTSKAGDADTVEYLTVEDFAGAYAIGESNITGAASDQTVDYDTVQDNYPGSGVELGTNGVAEYDCLTSNGDYGVQAYSTYDTSALTTGPQDVTVADNEISYNDQCNYEAIPAGYFPITPPSQCGSVGNQGCGCAGGAHFWNVDGSNFSDNDVHNNYDVASWWDTDNNGETIEHNYYANNFAEAVDIEISYNALIEDNNFVDNTWGTGACGAAPGDACYTDGNLASAIYISESGGNPAVVGNAHGIGTITIAGDNFDNNWDGVELYQSSNRFCGSPDNTSTGYCTLVPGASAYWDGSGAPSGTYYANGSGSPGGCGPADLAGATSSASPDYYDNCQWKTQDVAVTDDTFSFDAAAIPGCSASSASPCGENGLASQVASGISWSPYQATAGAYAVPDAITNCTAGGTYPGCTSQDNYFSHNTYTHTGSQDWQFYYAELAHQVSISTWQSDGQDSGSSFS
jgi:hypothetical protein